MRKSFFLSILAVGALVAGCAKSEVVDTKFNEEISFETYLGRDAQTKGTIIETDDLTAVGVYGYYTGGEGWDSETTANLWDPMTLACDKGQCTVKDEDVRYWTNESDLYTFLAYAPVDNANLDQPATDANPTLTYIVNPADFTKHVDVLVAEPQVDRKKGDGNVALVLKHKLSRLTVKATSDSDPFTFHIKKISLKGNFNTTGTIALAEPTAWDATPTENTEFVFATSDADASSENALPASIDYATVEGGAGYVMMLPTDAATHKAVLTVEYTTFDAKANLESRVYTQTYDVTNDFDMGKAYAIVLEFKNDATTINFSVKVDPDWGTENTVTIVEK